MLRFDALGSFYLSSGEMEVVFENSKSGTLCSESSGETGLFLVSGHPVAMCVYSNGMATEYYLHELSESFSFG
jgi:hypothetical protein